MAHILAAVLRRRHSRRGGGGNNGPDYGDGAVVPRIQSLYVASRAPFREVEQFIEYSADARTGYNMDLVRAHGSLRDALYAYIDGTLVMQEGRSLLEIHGETHAGEHRRSRHDIQAMFVGVRQGDPFGATLDIRAPCDADWPPIMRIHPILRWEYADVWAFLRSPLLANKDDTAEKPAGVAGGGRDGVPYCSLYDLGYVADGDRPN